MVYVGWRITEPNTFYQKFRGGSDRALAESQLEGMLAQRQERDRWPASPG